MVSLKDEIDESALMFRPRTATLIMFPAFPPTISDAKKFVDLPVMQRFKRIKYIVETNINKLEAAVFRDRPKSRRFLYLTSSMLPLFAFGRTQELYKLPDMEDMLTERLGIIGARLREQKYRLVFRAHHGWGNPYNDLDDNAELDGISLIITKLGYKYGEWHPDGLSILISPAITANPYKLINKWRLLPLGVSKLLCLENNQYFHVSDYEFIGRQRIPTVFNIGHHAAKTGGIMSIESPWLEGIKEHWGGTRSIIIQPNNTEAMNKYTQEMAAKIRADIIPIFDAT